MRTTNQGRKQTTHRGAPDEMRILVAFLNTDDVGKDSDALSKPRELKDWLHRQGLLAADVTPTWAQLSKALDVRDGLHALLLAHLGGALDPHVMHQLDEAAQEARPRVRFHEDGSDSFASEDFDEALGQLIELVVRTRREGQWDRLKVCADKACRTVFYDVAANRTTKWCSRRCGDRVRSHAYRRGETYRRWPHRSPPRLPRIFRTED